jgi:hypothetical protein
MSGFAWQLLLLAPLIESPLFLFIPYHGPTNQEVHIHVLSNEKPFAFSFQLGSSPRTWGYNPAECIM